MLIKRSPWGYHRCHACRSLTRVAKRVCPIRGNTCEHCNMKIPHKRKK